MRVAQALVRESMVGKEYVRKGKVLYRDKQGKQHSIGRQYIKIYL